MSLPDPNLPVAEYAALTDVGRARSNNEDAGALSPQAGLVVLADGMGGYNAGEVASQMLVSFLHEELGTWLQSQSPSVPDAGVLRAMDICVDNANKVIFQAAHTRPECAGMGTTLVVAVFRPGRLLLGHIGDSRAYCWRDGQLLQLTRDHSLLQEQIDAGLITDENAAGVSYKNLVTRAVGVEPRVQLSTQLVPTQPGDVYLLCSDGLSDMLDAKALRALTRDAASVSLDLLAHRLVDAANTAGGRDNISVILVRAQNGAPPQKSWWSFLR